MDKFVRRGLIGFGRFALATNPGKKGDGEDQPKGTEDSNHSWNFICKSKQMATMYERQFSEINIDRLI